MISLRRRSSLLVLGRRRVDAQVAFFRAALAPQQAFAVVSAPARLILLTEQTRDWERGTRDAVFAGMRRYMAGHRPLLSAVDPGAAAGLHAELGEAALLREERRRGRTQRGS